MEPGSGERRLDKRTFAHIGFFNIEFQKNARYMKFLIFVPNPQAVDLARIIVRLFDLVFEL